MEFKDYYRILGVDEQATDKEIKSAYRKLARKYHPDVSKETDADERFKEVGEAYEVLKDKDKRAEYDQIRQYGHGQRFEPPPDWQSANHFYGGNSDSNQQHQHFSDFFEAMFGRQGTAHRQYHSGHQQSFQMRGEDIHISLPLLLEEMVKGGKHQIEYQVPVVDERGMVSHQHKKLNIKIPKTLDPQKPLRLKGQGAPGVGGAAAGDLLIEIKQVPHPDYQLKGKDLHRRLTVMPWEAALGSQTAITLLDGKQLRLTIPANSKPGNHLKLKNKGLSGGDLFLELTIGLPNTHSEAAKSCYRQLADIYQTGGEENH